MRIQFRWNRPLSIDTSATNSFSGETVPEKPRVSITVNRTTDLELVLRVVQSSKPSGIFLTPAKKNTEPTPENAITLIPKPSGRDKSQRTGL